MEDKMVRVSVDRLIEVSMALLVKYGVSDADAKVMTNTLVEADLCGVNTHGIAVLPAHLEKLARGGYNINPELSIIREGLSFSVLDGNNSMGPISAHYSMQIAIRKAKEQGAYFVFSRNNNTFGPAFCYTSLASNEGLIGIAICNTPATMAPWGGKEKLLGTNPISIAIPVLGKPPILLDMATSAVAKSKLNLARIKGQEIPLGWATDSEGVPTTDPEQAISGLMLPMAEYKGYGLALMIDILAGVLSGAAFLDNVGSFYRDMENGMNVGFMFIALNPEKIYGSGFPELIESYIHKVKSCSPVNGEKKVIIPGENEAKQREENLRIGPELHISTIDKINKCLKEKNINMYL